MENDTSEAPESFTAGPPIELQTESDSAPINEQDQSKPPLEHQKSSEQKSKQQSKKNSNKAKAKTTKAPAKKPAAKPAPPKKGTCVRLGVNDEIPGKCAAKDCPLERRNFLTGMLLVMYEGKPYHASCATRAKIQFSVPIVPKRT